MNFKDIVNTKNNMRIIYNANLEAVYTILLLSGYNIISPYHKKYKSSILKHFSGYVNTYYVQYFSHMCFDKFRFTVPCVFALSLDWEDDMLCWKYPMKQYYIDRMGGEDVVNESLKSLNQFIKETSYADYFISNEKQYRQFLNAHVEILFNVMNDVQVFYDNSNINYIAYISQLVHPGGFGVSIDSLSSKIVIGSILNDTENINTSLCYNNYFHEFSHHFIDSYIFENWEFIKKTMPQKLMCDILNNEILAKEFICETIIRALSNYYCIRNNMSINYNDFNEYPISKILFEALKKLNVDIVNQDLYDLLLDIILKEI